MFAMLNGMEVVAILAVVLIMFGAKKLPELARGLGQGIKEFKKSSREITDEIHSAIDVDTPPPPAAPRKAVTDTQPRAAVPTARDIDPNAEEVVRVTQTKGGSSNPVPPSALPRP